MVMQLSDIKVLTVYGDSFQPAIPRMRQGKHVQILVLRETKSYAVFTTEGQTLDVEHVQGGIQRTNPVDRVVMYKRKQVAPERRKGKETMRALGVTPAQDEKIGRDTKSKRDIVRKGDCQIMGNACGVCADCILYGFAATMGTASQRARVLTDSAFSIREQSQIMRDIKLNAIQETTAGGIAGSAYAHRENVLPQVFLPSVEALVDVTAGEFVYVLGNILRTSRYGAESGREGFVRNHILGVYFSDTELFSNLELTQLLYDEIVEHDSEATLDYLDLQHVAPPLRQVAASQAERAYGSSQALDDTELGGLLDEVGALYRDPQGLRDFYRALDQAAVSYAVNTKPAGQAASGAAEEEVSG
jgi:CRISPR-associated protein Csc2